MAREVVVNCDVCGQSGAKGYEIVTPDTQHWTVDLCTKCAAPVQEVVKAGRPDDGQQNRPQATKAQNRLARRIRNAPPPGEMRSVLVGL